MKFTIEEKVSKSGKPYAGLYCEGQLVCFIRSESLNALLFKYKINADEVGLEKYELKIYPKEK